MVINLIKPIYVDGNSIKEQEMRIIRDTIDYNKYSSLLDIGTYYGNVIYRLYDLVVEKYNGCIDSVDTLAEDCVWNRDELEGMHEYNLNVIEENALESIELHMNGSDEFFKKNKKTFDCVIVDGNKEMEQVKRDIINSCKVLNDNGQVIVYAYRIPSVSGAIKELDPKKYIKHYKVTIYQLALIKNNPKYYEYKKVNKEKYKTQDHIHEEQSDSITV